jgi:glycosyltransferase involved in cell wall biosynthesis
VSIAIIPLENVVAPAPLESLSIVLPCFNEAENVAAAVAEAQAAARAVSRDHEVVVVDDGSTDDTRAIATALAFADPCVRVVVHEANRGYGAAVRSGIAATAGDWVLLTDGDRQFDLAELGRAAPLTRSADLVAGYRIGRADPAHRRSAAHCWNALMRMRFAIPVRDVDCAFKLVRGELVRGLSLESEGALISTELVVGAQQRGWSITEIGVHHRPRVAGEATGGNAGVILRAFAEQRAFHRRVRQRRGGGATAAPVVSPRGSRA